MKILKITDLLGQLLAGVGGLIYFLANGQQEETWIAIYFAVGGWQMLSFLTHIFIKENWVSQVDRKYYGSTILWAFVIGLFCYAALFANSPVIIYYLFMLLIVSPFLAIWYFIICYKEFQRMKQREQVQLK